jgi:hypothetical protein
MRVMRITSLNPIFGVLALTVSCFATTLPAKAQSVTPTEAQQIATDAYVYGYS